MKVMKKSISLALILLGYTVAIPAVQAEGYEYYSNQGALVYGSNFGGQKKIIAKFTGINRRDLYPVENISGEQERYIIEDEVTTIKEEYHWITDGHVILWRGKIVSNPPGTPMVDVASFKALGRFAVDKYSLYFDGQRTESNSGASKVDLATLKAIEDNSSTLVDRHNLYLLGRRQASSDDFSVLQSKLWGDIERFRPRNEGLPPATCLFVIARMCFSMVSALQTLMLTPFTSFDGSPIHYWSTATNMVSTVTPMATRPEKWQRPMMRIRLKSVKKPSAGAGNSRGMTPGPRNSRGMSYGGPGRIFPMLIRNSSI